MSQNDQLSRGAILGIGAGILAVACGVLFYLFCFVTVPKGEVGVKSWFGDLEDGTLQSGPHVVNPLKKVYRMNTQTQKDEEPASVPTKNGLPVNMKATLLYRLDGTHAPKMAREVGDHGYQERVVSPYFKNAVRDVTAEYLPEAFYSSERTAIETKISERLRAEFEPRGLIVESVMLLEPVLPDVVRQRIEAKVGAEQDAIRMESVYKQKELEGKTKKRVAELDAESKVIEAKGIADAQQIIKKDLDHNYLVYLWIQALRDNHNSTIYVPTGGDGMPLFKGIAGR